MGDRGAIAVANVEAAIVLSKSFGVTLDRAVVRGLAAVCERAGMSLETASSRLSELAPITQRVKRQKNALGEFVERCKEKPCELAIPRQTLRGACQRYER